MSKLVFKPEDFQIPMSTVVGPPHKAFADTANRIFEEWLSEQKEVYQDTGYEYWGSQKTLGPKPMRARLVCIEEAPKKDLPFKPGDIVTPVEIVYYDEGSVSPGAKGIVAEVTAYSVRVQFVGYMGTWCHDRFKAVQ